MRILFYVLLALGIAAITDSLVYIIAEQYYEKNPETEKSYRFELLDVVFRHKYAKAIYIAAGVIFISAAVLIRVNLGKENVL